ncbi:MAG: hypothetical protein ABIT38_11110 [Gemmatimonadaceae bacterium]
MSDDADSALAPDISPNVDRLAKGENSGDAGALHAALASRALDFLVEGRGGVALLVARSASAGAIDVATRRLLVQLARDAGYTNVALDVSTPEAVAGDDAALLSRNDP